MLRRALAMIFDADSSPGTVRMASRFTRRPCRTLGNRLRHRHHLHTAIHHLSQARVQVRNRKRTDSTLVSVDVACDGQPYSQAEQDGGLNGSNRADLTIVHVGGSLQWIA